MLQKISTDKAPAAIGPYSQGIVLGNIFFASGQIPIDPATGEIHGTTIEEQALNALPIPTKYGQECLMAPEEIAEVMVFLASDSARGVNGNIMFVDGGTDALLNSEKVY